MYEYIKDISLQIPSHEERCNNGEAKTKGTWNPWCAKERKENTETYQLRNVACLWRINMVLTLLTATPAALDPGGELGDPQQHLDRSI